MLSTFPVNTMSFDYLFPTPFPVYEPDLPPSEWQEPPAFVFPLQPNKEQDVPPQEQLNSDSDSDSDNSKPNQHAISSSGSDDREPNDNNSKPNHAISSSCSDGRKPNGNNNSISISLDERKRRRMLSNRESARRSRMRKKSQLDGLMHQLNQLRAQNQELESRLRSVTHCCILLQRNNKHILAELSELRQTLSLHGHAITS